jgi:ubiquinone/menaquinone biosynthesis C-methylase UbiE
MADQHPEIIAHYQTYQEAHRLTGAEGRLEYLRTAEIVERHLSPPPAVVVDVGGGRGVYATWLARKGYRVHLFDVVPHHVDGARRTAHRGMLTAAISDARALPVCDASAKAVLLLGPLYHLVKREDRIKALREARRILRPGGVLFAAGISRFASAIDGVMRDLLADPAFRDIVERDLVDGQHRNPTKHPRYFTTAFFHHPRELLDEVREAEFVEPEILGVEGVGWAVPNLGQALDDGQTRERLLGVLRRLEAEPALPGASPHLLAVARCGGA